VKLATHLYTANTSSFNWKYQGIFIEIQSLFIRYKKYPWENNAIRYETMLAWNLLIWFCYVVLLCLQNWPSALISTCILLLLNNLLKMFYKEVERVGFHFFWDSYKYVIFCYFMNMLSCWLTCIIYNFPVGKIAEKTVGRSVFLLVWHSKYRVRLSKINSYRPLFRRFYPLGLFTL